MIKRIGIMLLAMALVVGVMTTAHATDRDRGGGGFWGNQESPLVFILMGVYQYNLGDVLGKFDDSYPIGSGDKVFSPVIAKGSSICSPGVLASPYCSKLIIAG